MVYENSKIIYERAIKSIPGGVNSPVRAFKSVGEENPVFIKSAKGSKIYDEDDNEYIDYIGSWGPAILGHGRREIIEALTEAAENGSCFGLPTKKEVELAELVKRAIPSMEKIRLTSSGTEAVMSAVRLARAYTGRNKIVKFDGCYHGHSDSMLVKAGSGLLTYGNIDSNGITVETTNDTMTLPYNNLEAVEKYFEQFGAETACLIIEPMAANMGVIVPSTEYLKGLRKTTEKHGTVFIFDEVITGFRVGFGGAQEYYGVKPDMTILGKIIGGGCPVGAFGGKKEIMDMISPLGNVYQAGTLSGNPLSTSCGIAALRILDNEREIYNRIEDKTKKIAESIIKSGDKHNIKVSVNMTVSLLTLFFTDTKVINLDTAMTSDTEMYGKFFRLMLEAGIMLPPSQFEAWFISDAYSDEDIEKTCLAVDNAFNNMNRVEI